MLVAGGSRGIGRGVAAAFAAQGAQTVLVSFSAENLAIAAQAISLSSPVLPKVCAADLRTEGGCNSVFEFIGSTFGRCNILVNSAGAMRGGSSLSLSADD